MKLSDFVKDNREEVDRRIYEITGKDVTRSDANRVIFIYNNEKLLNWAKKNGVKV